MIILPLILFDNVKGGDDRLSLSAPFIITPSHTKQGDRQESQLISLIGSSFQTSNEPGLGHKALWGVKTHKCAALDKQTACPPGGKRRRERRWYNTGNISDDSGMAGAPFICKCQHTVAALQDGHDGALKRLCCKKWPINKIASITTADRGWKIPSLCFLQWIN